MERVTIKLLKYADSPSVIIPTKHSHRKPLEWYDEDQNVTRSLRFARNQRSIFEDEQDGNARMTPIVVEDGMMSMDKRKDATLIKFLQHHPDNKENGGRLFEFMDRQQDAQEEIDMMEQQFKATDIARNLDLNDLERVGLSVFGHKAANLPSNELKRDVIIYARNYPNDFLDLFDDTSSEITMTVQKALVEGIIQFRKSNTELYWNTSKKSMICRIEKGRDHMDYVEKFLMSNKGLSAYKELEELIS
jgi:hypothetical protein